MDNTRDDERRRKCAHEPCLCMVQLPEEYCSAYCETSDEPRSSATAAMPLARWTELREDGIRLPSSVARLAILALLTRPILEPMSVQLELCGRSQ
jgi:hypothetical protein